MSRLTRFQAISVLDGVKYQINAFFYSEPSRIKAHIIVFRVAPLTVGVVLVIYFTLLVLVVKALLRFFLAFAVQSYNAFSARFHIGVDKYVENIVPVPQNVIGAAADYNAGLFREFQFYLPLHAEQKVGYRQTVLGTRDTLR